MKVIKLTYSDLNEMVRHALHSVLNESVREVQGSIMAEKDDVVQEIIDYIAKEWEKIKSESQEPEEKDTANFKSKDGNAFPVNVFTYQITIPQEIVAKLGVAVAFEVIATIHDFEIPEQYAAEIGWTDRATEGSSFGGGEFNEFIKPKLMVKRSKITMFVPSIRGEILFPSLAATLYHELNHTVSRLAIQQKMYEKNPNISDKELNSKHFFSMSQREDEPPHALTHAELHPDPFRQFLDAMGGNREDEETKQQKYKLSFIFYSLWEITELNAKVEGLYGELKTRKATREDFKTIYPETDFYHQFNDIQRLINDVRTIPATSKAWVYAGRVMGMKRRGKSNGISFGSQMRYMTAIKERFLSRSKDLMEKLYRKAMKVSELYFQRQEPPKAPSKLQLHKQKHNK